MLGMTVRLGPLGGSLNHCSLNLARLLHPAMSAVSELLLIQSTYTQPVSCHHPFSSTPRLDWYTASLRSNQ